MRCPNCNAECSEQANACEFCGQSFSEYPEHAIASVEPQAGSSPPPIPDYSSPPRSGFESDNPYAASDSSLYGRPQVPNYEMQNHLALSITAAVLSFLCCCVPFGIVPVIFATQVNTKLANGDLEGAQASANNAKLWSWICIGVAIGIFVLNMVFQIGLGLF